MSSKKRKSPSEWQALVAEQQASGLSVAAFCLKHGLVDKTFYHQRNKLSRAPDSDGRAKRGFVQVQPTPAAINASPGSLVLHHRNGQVTYYHQVLGAVLVHPEQREVFPLAPEPILKQDGQKKKTVNAMPRNGY